MSGTKSVWRVPAYLPHLQPPLTAAAIEDAERALGVKLPESYLDRLREQNGGYLRLTLPDSVSDTIWGIGPHFPSITSGFDWQDLTPEEQADWGWAPAGARWLVPFDGDGHWHLCLDYRAGGPQAEPRVSVVDLETERDEEIAPDFATFLAALREDFAHDTFGLVGVALDEAVDALEAQLRVTFEPAQSCDHGYPIRRCAFGRGRPPDWAWLSPNRAPRGFVRESDPRYAELVGLLPGTALRLPDHPEVDIVLQCTEGAVDRIVEACARAALRSTVIHRMPA